MVGAVILGLGVTTPRAKATVIYTQDFSTVSSGWNIGTTTPGTISFAPGSVSGPAFPTRSLQLSHIPSNTTRMTSSMPTGQYSVPLTSTESTTFEFDLRLSRTDSSGWVSFMNSSVSNQLPMYINVTSNGNFLVGYWNGTANTTLTLLSGYAADTTYTFTFTTTPSTGLFSASVTGGTASLTNQAYRRTSAGVNAITSFDWMQIYNDGGTASGANFDMYIDNINIQTVPEPSVVASLLCGGLFLVVCRRRFRTSQLA
jgi:hypothetical protein